MGLLEKFRIIKNAYNNTENKGLIIKKIMQEVKRGGLGGLKSKIIDVSVKQDSTPQVESMTTADIYDMQQKEVFVVPKSNTSFGIIIEVKHANVDITGTLNSLKNQSYQNFQIYLIAPNQYQSEIKNVYYFEKNASEVINHVIEEASEEYLFFLNGANILSPDCLAQIAEAVDFNYDMIYFDEYIFDGANGNKIKHFIKPDFSKFDLTHRFYIEQGVVFSKKAIKESGGFDGSFCLFDTRIKEMSLKIGLTCRNIKHLERILLMRNSFVEEISELETACLFRKINQNYEMPFYFSKKEANEKFVSIILPTDDYNLSVRCIESIILHTWYFNFEIIVVSSKELCLQLQEHFPGINFLNYVEYDEPFCYTRKCNKGAETAKGEILLFLHDYVLTAHKQWLSSIAAIFSLPYIGGVSPKILRKDNTIRYAGIISGGFGFFPIPFNGDSIQPKLDFNEPVFENREVSILSATCLAVRKDLFSEIGGFHEENTPDKFSNAVLSFEIRKKGFSCIYCADATFYADGGNWYDSWFEKESKTAYLYILKNYIDFLTHDPFFTESMKIKMLKNLPIDYHIYK